MESVLGLVLAAGAGSRAQGPKALRRDATGTPWLHHAVHRSFASGCAEVLVVLGADAERTRTLLPVEATIVLADDWAAGVSASLLAGLQSAAERTADAVLITLVDLPSATAAPGRRLVASAAGALETALAQASYDARPGHPVLIGRWHWLPLEGALHGDAGARDYLRAHEAPLIECGDLESGDDVDTAP